jgi:hypothetical protein
MKQQDNRIHHDGNEATNSPQPQSIGSIGDSTWH